MEPLRQQPNEGGSKIWLALFAAVLIWLALVLSWEIRRPWIDGVDFNGAVWSQAAHNILRAGLTETAGGSSGFYFGPLPIPSWGYYLHHPPLLHLTITGLFAILGEHEWVARLVPVVCSLASAVFLWLLVRSCVGARTATLSAAVFASLPMQLTYGSMVNFEPCVLMLMLAALLCLRWHHLSGEAKWKYVALGLILVGLWVDWAMYLFVVALCVCWLLRSKGGDRRFAAIIFLSTLVSGALYLLRIRLLRPDAWQSLSDAFMVRLGTGKGGYFTEAQWLTRMGETLATYFLPVGLILGAIGAAILWRARSHEGFQWLGRASLVIVVMDLLFVGLFRNVSYIHQYSAFYFLAPLSIAAGVALDHLITAFQPAATPRLFRRLAELSVCLMVVALAAAGLDRTQALTGQFKILDYHTNEPPGLIPELGHAIRANFSADTRILCNFLPDYGPHLAYYAKRDILNNLSEYRFWDPYVKDASKRIGGVVWVSSHPASQNILASLPASGTKQFLTVGQHTFCLWKPGEARQTTTAGAGGSSSPLPSAPSH
ncbi:MAG TPA: glycosyltransferase family 39 protein [Chthoniobacterales bacterium]|nr:glycosyltransferase family 39 protein [Chthoniobacterales bacterium]